jgi:G protein beta subunit-like protein
MPGAVILATASYDHTIRFWEAHTGKYKLALQHQDSQINKMEISPDRVYLAAAGNPSIKFYEIESRHANAVINFSGHSNNVTSLGFHKDGKWMYSGSEDGTVKIWDVNAPGCQRELKEKVPVNTVILHPNQTELICGYQDGVVRVYDLNTNKALREIIPEDDAAVRSLTITNDGQLLCAATGSGNCFVYKLDASSWSNNSNTNATTSLGSNTVLSTGFELATQFAAHKTYVLKAQFSPNNKLLATASADSTVKIWNVQSPSSFVEDKTLTGHTQWVWDCAFSADSAYLVTASSDQMARLWDLSQGETVRHYSGHTRAVSCVALNDLIEDTPTNSAGNTPPVPQRTTAQNLPPPKSPRGPNAPTQVTQMRVSPSANNLANQAQQAPPPSAQNTSQPGTPRK